jgi:hypothetical protein
MFFLHSLLLLLVDLVLVVAEGVARGLLELLETLSLVLSYPFVAVEEGVGTGQFALDVF